MDPRLPLSPRGIKLRFPTNVTCLIIHPSLATFPPLSYFSILLFHLPNELLAFENLFQDLVSGEPKLRHYLDDLDLDTT